jgi:tetratricopeptide (TPR) repeat protein
MRINSLVVIIVFLSPFFCVASGTEKEASRFVSSQYLAASYASRHHNLEEAAKLFSEILEHDSQDSELLNKSYRSHLYSGNIPQAVLYAERVLELDPNDNLAKLVLAVNALKHQQYTKSQAYLQITPKLEALPNENLPEENASHYGPMQEKDFEHEAVDEHMDQEDLAQPQPTSGAGGIEEATFPYLLLWSKAGEGKFDEAIADAKNMINLESENQPFLYFQVALLADFANQYEKAAHYYEKGLDSHYRSYSYVKAAANFYERQNNSKRALEIYREFQGLHPNLGYFSNDVKRIKYKKLAKDRFLKEPSAGAAEILAEIGRMLFGVEAYIQSVGYLQMVLFLSPGHHDTTILLSAYYGDNEQYDKAVRLYRQVRLGDDLYYPSRVYLAEHLYHSGQKGKAHRQLLALSKHRAIHDFALITLADLLRKDQEYTLAIQIYNQVIEDIETPKNADWMLFFARGMCYEQLKLWQQAEEDLMLALKIQPNQPEVLNYLGYSWLDRGINLNKSIEMIELALKQRPEDAQIIDSRGWAFYLSKDYKNAARYLEKAVEIAPQDPVINDHLGDVYWFQERKMEARFQWRKSIKYHTDKEEITTIEHKIKNGI